MIDLIVKSIVYVVVGNLVLLVVIGAVFYVREKESALANILTAIITLSILAWIIALNAR